MGNSTYTLQRIVDIVQTIGDLAPVIPAGGYSGLLAKEIGNAVMADLISERFNWKWNRTLPAPFRTISRQQDYPQRLTNIGWLESACMVDINNVQLPKPLRWLSTKRELDRSSLQLAEPEKICWLYNEELIQEPWAGWPGAAVTFTDPLGASPPPSNQLTHMVDAHGNLLMLTTFGTTGSSAPLAPPPTVTAAVISAIARVVGFVGNEQVGVVTATTSAPHGLFVGQEVDIAGVTDATFDVEGTRVISVPTPTTFTYQQTDPLTNASSSGGTATGQTSDAGMTIQDGTCVWTVVGPREQGFRIYPPPAQRGTVWQIHVKAQLLPPKFTTMEQSLSPIPDDYARHFIDGFIAYTHRHSAAPVVRARFPEARAIWLKALADARGQGDREESDPGITPERGVMDSPYGGGPIGPAWPFGFR